MFHVKPNKPGSSTNIIMRIGAKKRPEHSAAMYQGNKRISLDQLTRRGRRSGGLVIWGVAAWGRHCRVALLTDSRIERLSVHRVARRSRWRRRRPINRDLIVWWSCPVPEIVIHRFGGKGRKQTGRRGNLLETVSVWEKNAFGISNKDSRIT